MFKSYSNEKGLYMLTKDGTLWMDGATKQMIWLERFFKYDTVFPMKRAAFFLYPLPAGLLIGMIPMILAALLGSPNVGLTDALRAVAICLAIAFASIWIGLAIRKIDKFPRRNVHYAAGDYPRIELLILAHSNTKQHRERLWACRKQISDLLKDSGNSDTSEFGLESVERRSKELERREMIKHVTTTILTAMGEDLAAIEVIVQREFDKLHQSERDRLDASEITCHQDILSAHQRIAYKERRLEELGLLRVMMN